ncbi:MAG: TonB family protein [Acidobacteria bacterium]|nr:TonB family protein [Acidobacteriota bacterium]
MYLDFDDRPDIPRVPQAISVREGVLLSIIVHLAFVIFLLVAPAEWFEAAPEEAAQAEQQEPLRFVQVMPLIDRRQIPNPEADRSEFDLRAKPTPVPAPDAAPAPPAPDVPRTEPAPGPETPDPLAPSPSTLGAMAPPEPERPPPPRPSGSLGNAFRDLGRYLQEPQVSAQQPGIGEGDSGADVEMLDSKGRPIEGIDFGPWMRRFAAQIRRNWIIPQVAEMSRGRVVVTFTVLRNGTLIDLQVRQPAAIGALTQAAVTALKLSNPTSVLPAEYQDDRVLFTVTFHYNEPLRDRQ